MYLTPAQNVIVAAFVTADPALSTVTQDQYGADTIQQALNKVSAVDHFVYKTDTPALDLFDQITWTNFTPNDLPPVAAVPSAPTAAETYALTLWKARALQCQGKQFNLQTMLVGRSTLNTAKTNIRAGLQDCLTAIPSGSGGVNRSAGWVAVQTTLYRKATVLEKILAAGTGTAASPATMAVEGAINLDEVMTAMGWTYA